MIKKPSTSAVMAQFKEDVEKIETLRTSVNKMQSELEDKINILDIQYEYALSSLLNLSGSTTKLEDKILFNEVEKRGRFDSFGMSVHPKLAKAPRNLFNIQTTKGYLFKNNMKVSVNGVYDDDFKEMLKEESISSKKAVIKEYAEDTIKLTIEMNTKASLGSLACNVLELAPYLPGSFNIAAINVYSKDNMQFPAQTFEREITRVGAQRIILSEKVEVGKIELDIKLLFKNAKGRYPFGLQHLYLLEANFLNDSYVVVRLNKSDNVAYIYDSLTVKTQFGESSSETVDDWGVTFWAQFDGEVLSHQLEVSTKMNPSYLSSNLKTIYIRMPLNTAITAIMPKLVTDSILAKN